ncbi:MAG: 3-mercaptopyruvate sulfurtransferase [Rhodovibrionaceae bacterium]|nr:3-mercaptopyruvate sulfurtransferase [Rhodovibrionaceae bacterium]
MARDPANALVSTEWLHNHLDAPDVRIVDATYYLPHENKDPRALFEEQHIPRAVFFDIDEISDTSSDLPHMLPPPEKFSSRVRRLGLGDGTRIVVYDQRGIGTAPRAWWTFRAFGHEDVAVLDGGLAKWIAEGRPVEDGPARPDERHFSARMNTLLVRDKEQVRRDSQQGREQILDARPRGRFEGTAEEIWPGRRQGHIPNSLNLPFDEMIDPETKTMLPPDRIRQRMEEAGIDFGKPVVTTCGSGVTACTLALGLYLSGHRDVAVYDGSWAEWGLPGDTEVETGPPARAAADTK